MNPILALIIANVIWGAASPIFKFALQNIPPFTLAFIRFFFGGLIFLPFVIGHWQKLTVKDWLMICLGGLFGISINIAFFFLGLVRTESINAPIIASAGPVFLFLISVFFLKEKFHQKVFTGMFLSLIGVLVIILSPIFLDGKKIVTGEVTGNLFLILATIGAVIDPLLLKNVLKKVSACQVSLISFLFGAVTFIPFMFNELQSWSPGQLNINGWVGIVFGVLFSSAIAYYLFNYGISKISAQEIGVFTYIDPIVAVIIAMPLLGEFPNLYFLIGSLLVFIGILIAENRVHWHPFHKVKNFNTIKI
jgi:drug/metabolite transporter (DMT)-like permease